MSGTGRKVGLPWCVPACLGELNNAALAPCSGDGSAQHIPARFQSQFVLRISISPIRTVFETALWNYEHLWRRKSPDVPTGRRRPVRPNRLEIDVLVPIEQIFPDPELPSEPAATRAAERHRGRASETPIVQPLAAGGYVLLSGRRGIKAAKEAGVSEIEVKVRQQVSRQERQELRLSEQYHNGLVPPMVMAKEFYTYRKSHGITQQELARRTGITPGTIHHYESLIRTLDPPAWQTRRRGRSHVQRGAQHRRHRRPQEAAGDRRAVPVRQAQFRPRGTHRGPGKIVAGTHD